MAMLLGGATLALGVWGAAATSSASSTSPRHSARAASPCGTYHLPLPPDPGHVLPALPAANRAAYEGYGYPVYKSAWSAWKPPTHGLTVGIAWEAPANDYAALTLAYIKSVLVKDPAVSKVITFAGASITDIPAQVQEYESLVQKKVSLIITQSTTGAPFVADVKAAAKQGIPTVSAFDYINSPYAVNVTVNGTLPAAQQLSVLVRAIHGKGSLLDVHGIPGISIDENTFKGVGAVLANCPGVTVVGSVTGDFSPSTAKSAVLQFLSTHPGPVSIVANGGGMDSGIIGAFQSAGRPVPEVNGPAATKAYLGYWWAHRSTFVGAGNGGGPTASGQVVAGVAERMLAGDGVTSSVIVIPTPLITAQNLKLWASPSWNLQTLGTAQNPPSSYSVSGTLNPVFKK